MLRSGRVLGRGSAAQLAAQMAGRSFQCTDAFATHIQPIIINFLREDQGYWGQGSWLSNWLESSACVRGFLGLFSFAFFVGIPELAAPKVAELDPDPDAEENSPNKTMREVQNFRAALQPSVSTRDNSH